MASVVSWSLSGMSIPWSFLNLSMSSSPNLLLADSTSNRMAGVWTARASGDSGGNSDSTTSFPTLSGLWGPTRIFLSPRMVTISATLLTTSHETSKVQGCLPVSSFDPSLLNVAASTSLLAGVLSTVFERNQQRTFEMQRLIWRSILRFEICIASVKQA
ncbi:hypothetical protein OUZ56_028669 [Daphnia magna]|uniref:Secreted protein n=1 Tax=Daphnia magna TaxID=35525 RepID=A0ABR0B4K0_9CRUS|nr:hypothetical protein OUZ56_028669 [Daphnia magna]